MTREGLLSELIDSILVHDINLEKKSQMLIRKKGITTSCNYGSLEQMKKIQRIFEICFHIDDKDYENYFPVVFPVKNRKGEVSAYLFRCIAQRIKAQLLLRLYQLDCDIGIRFGIATERVVIIVMLLVALRRQSGMLHNGSGAVRNPEMQFMRGFRSFEDRQGIVPIISDAGDVMPPHL